MDEVRLWSVARSQSDILRTMRWVSGLEKEPGLVGWWKFDEPSEWVVEGNAWGQGWLSWLPVMSTTAAARHCLIFLVTG
jgi:hypothetical protein